MYIFCQIPNFILQEKKLFSSVLLDSRLVAKFLGFVTFLPYQSPDKLPDNVESTYIAIRSKVIMCWLHVLYTSFKAALRGRPANKPRQWKSMLTHQGWFKLLYMQPLLASQTIEFVIRVCARIFFSFATSFANLIFLCHFLDL